MYTIKESRRAIMNKWDWENPTDNITTILWGPPGIGKTWLVYDVVVERLIKELEEKKQNQSLTVEEVANLETLKTYYDPKQIEKIISKNLLVLRLAERPIEQIEGVPAPDFKNRSTIFLMPENLIELRDAKWVVVFVDELDKASESKMAAATHLVESGIVGDFQLPKDTFIVCAANRVSDSWLSKPVSPELCNRMAHVEMEADVESWVEWARSKKLNERFIGFINFKDAQHENYLVKNNEDVDSESPKAFVSPRTLHKAAKQFDKIYLKYKIEYGENKEIDNEVRKEVEQLVGDTVAADFYVYLELYSKVDIKALLTGKQKMPSGTDRDKVMPEQYVYAFALGEQLAKKHLKIDGAPEHLKNIIEVMLPEVRAVFVQLLSSNNKEVLASITKDPRYAVIVDEILDYMGGD
ncbi:MAG TPA: ATP-binding protein [Candidatus Glassbacteria bacterium]|nr:ATP-binding protein [Candidatus Glassbacteria bacterium]